jgi:hypothetical protein
MTFRGVALLLIFTDDRLRPTCVGKSLLKGTHAAQTRKLDHLRKRLLSRIGTPIRALHAGQKQKQGLGKQKKP